MSDEEERDGSREDDRPDLKQTRRTPIPTGPHIKLDRSAAAVDEEYIAETRFKLDHIDGTLEVITGDGSDPYGEGDWWDGGL